MFQDTEVPELKALAFRKIVLQLFQSNINRHNVSIKDATTLVKYYVRRVTIPSDMRDRLLTSCGQSFSDVHRWWEKHGEIFQDRKARRSQHLRLFFDNLVWDPSTIMVDDYNSAKRIIETNTDWPQLQFQFACAYAMESELRGFDKIWIRAFRKKLNDHPLYDFWFSYLTNTSHVVDIFDNGPALMPNQLVTLAFQWAIGFGYEELTKFFWRHVTAPQAEYVSLLQWRHLVRTAKHDQVFQYLCQQLCSVNGVNMVRITTPVFIHSIQNALDRDQSVTAKEQHTNRVRFLINNGCEVMRRGLFEAQNYRALSTCIQRRNAKMTKLLQAAVSPQQMMSALERVGVDYPRVGGASNARGRGLRQWSMG